MINRKFQLLYGEKLPAYPRLTMLLKSLKSGYVRKTPNTFTKKEIFRFLESAPNENEFNHVNFGVVLSYYGGLWCVDLVDINCHDIKFKESTGELLKNININGVTYNS